MWLWSRCRLHPYLLPVKIMSASSYIGDSEVHWTYPISLMSRSWFIPLYYMDYDYSFLERNLPYSRWNFCPSKQSCGLSSISVSTTIWLRARLKAQQKKEDLCSFLSRFLTWPQLSYSGSNWQSVAPPFPRDALLRYVPAWVWFERRFNLLAGAWFSRMRMRRSPYC